MAETFDQRLLVLPSGMELEPAETRARLALFGQLLGSKPMATNIDLELTAEGYLNMTADLPYRWLQLSIRWHLLDPIQRFAPTIGEIRHRAALEFLRAWRSQNGDDPDRQGDGRPVHLEPGRIDLWIGRARKAEGLPEIAGPTSAVGLLPEGWEERIKAIGSGEASE